MRSLYACAVLVGIFAVIVGKNAICLDAAYHYEVSLISDIYVYSVSDRLCRSEV